MLFNIDMDKQVSGMCEMGGKRILPWEGGSAGGVLQETLMLQPFLIG